MTESMKKVGMITRRKPPMLGIHLPIRNDSTAATIAAQMNPSPNRYSGSPLIGLLKKNESAAASAVTARVPPTQTGLETQYSTALIAAGRRPNASRVHTYGPPSSGKAVPSSAMVRP